MPPREPDDRERRPALTLRTPSRWEILTGGLSAAAEALEEQRGLTGWLGNLLALYAVLRSAEEQRGRAERLDLARRLVDACRDVRITRGALERAAERMVLAEARLERARAALPALRGAAMGTSRAKVLAAIDALERALVTKT